jgi:hypothetical protein
MMRHRNAQTQDAIHPTRKQQAGRNNPSPLDLYNSHKAKGTKKSKRPRPPAALTTRVTIAHPPPQLRKATPRERARTYNAAVIAAIQNERAKRAITNAEMHAATYAAPFPHAVAPAPAAWDLNNIPYLVPNGPLQDLSRCDRYARILSMLNNQRDRAEAWERHLGDFERVAAQIELSIQDALTRNDPDVIASRQRQLRVRRPPGYLSKRSIAARARRHNSASAPAPPIYHQVFSDTPCGSGPEPETSGSGSNLCEPSLGPMTMSNSATLSPLDNSISSTDTNHPACQDLQELPTPGSAQPSVLSWATRHTLPTSGITSSFAARPLALPGSEAPMISTEVLQRARASLKSRRRKPLPKPRPESEPSDPSVARLRLWLNTPQAPVPQASDHTTSIHSGLAPDLADND